MDLDCFLLFEYIHLELGLKIYSKWLRFMFLWHSIKVSLVFSEGNTLW